MFNGPEDEEKAAEAEAPAEDTAAAATGGETDAEPAGDGQSA